MTAAIELIIILIVSTNKVNKAWSYGLATSAVVLVFGASGSQAQQLYTSYSLPFNGSFPSLSSQQYTQIVGTNQTASGYRLPTGFTDSISIGSMYAPNHRGFNNDTGEFTGLVNGACPSFGLADQRCATGVARPANAEALGGIAIGQNALVSSTGAGDASREVAPGEFGIAIGSSALVEGYHGVAVGLLSRASGVASTGLGPEARSLGVQSVAVGDISTASADGSTALGSTSTASGDYSTSVGFSSTSSGLASMAMGVLSEATGAHSIALGINARSDSTGSLSIGDQTSSTGDASLAIGYLTRANGLRSLSLGAEATAEGVSALAIGDTASSKGDGSIALGAGAQALGDYSTAIGPLAVATRNGQLVIGGPRTTEISIGGPGAAVSIPSLANNGKFSGRRNQNGSTEFITVDQNGSLGTTPNLSGYVRDTVQSMGANLSNAVNSTSALVAALSALPATSTSIDEPVRCGLGSGGIGSDYAFSAGCAVRIANRLHLNGGVSFANKIEYFGNTTPGLAGRIGFSFPLYVSRARKSAIDQTSSSDAKQDAMLQALKQENDSMRAELNTLKQLVAGLAKPNHGTSYTDSLAVVK